MTLTARLRSRQALVNHALNIRLKPVDGSPRILHEAMRYCVFPGGKRFRPLLCLGACEAAGGVPRAALPVACAIELIHTYSLVHDDLPAMDDADERRGRASCHRRFSEATAILVGDALLTRAFELLSCEGILNGLAIIRTIGKASGTSGLVGGQVLDLQRDGHKTTESIRRLEEVARRKTAALITASVMAGGLAGGASARVLDGLRRFGERVGLAFQLMDDVHDGDGLAQARGAEDVQRMALSLIDQAEGVCKPFGSRAWLLVELAEWLAHATA